MSPTPAQYALRAAGPSDRDLIKRFIQTPVYTYRHLDWRDPLDWLGRQPFWILEKSGAIEGVLCCIVEPDEVAWIRLFSANARISPSWAWNILFERIYTWLEDLPVRPTIASLGLQDWFTDMLTANGFQKFQDIIVLSYDDTPPEESSLNPPFLLRPMRREDVDRVTQVDNLAFEPIWRLSSNDIARAFDRVGYKTIIEVDGEVVGYQMSSINGFTAHLARLAVDPRIQRRRIGSYLVQDVLRHFLSGLDVWGVTLNTQNNNQASLALYRSLGFHLTGESFPVFVYPYRDQSADS